MVALHLAPYVMRENHQSHVRKCLSLLIVFSHAIIECNSNILFLPMNMASRVTNTQGTRRADLDICKLGPWLQTEAVSMWCTIVWRAQTYTTIFTSKLQLTNSFIKCAIALYFGDVGQYHRFFTDFFSDFIHCGIKRFLSVSVCVQIDSYMEPPRHRGTKHHNMPLPFFSYFCAE